MEDEKGQGVSSVGKRGIFWPLLAKSDRHLAMPGGTRNTLKSGAKMIFWHFCLFCRDKSSA